MIFLTQLRQKQDKLVFDIIRVMISYSKPTIEDIHRIQKLLNETWRDTYTFRSKEELRKIALFFHNTKALDSQIKNKNIFFRVARDEKQILGVVTATQVANKVNIGRLYVGPKHQGRGIGSRLLELAMSHYSSAEKIRVEVDTKNNISCSWYLSKGFKKVDVKTDTRTIKGITFNLVVMEKEI